MSAERGNVSSLHEVGVADSKEDLEILSWS